MEIQMTSKKQWTNEKAQNSTVCTAFAYAEQEWGRLNCAKTKEKLKINLQICLRIKNPYTTSEMDE